MTGGLSVTMKLQLLRKIWPAICGLVVGGLLGGLTGSWSIGALAGGAAWLCFIGLMHSHHNEDVSESSSCGYDPTRIVNPAEAPNAGDLQQQIALRNYGAVGMGTYAELYRDPDGD